MNEDKLFDTIFNMKFTAKQMNKSALHAEKDMDKEKIKVKKAIEKGNLDAARIYAENTIRKKNESINYLRLASRIDAAASRVETAVKMKEITKTMKNTVAGLSKVLESMDPIKIATIMNEFEKQVETVDVNLGNMNAAFESTSAGIIPINEVDGLMEQVAAQNNIDIKTKLAGQPLGGKLPAKKDAEDTELEDLERQLNNLRVS